MEPKREPKSIKNQENLYKNEVRKSMQQKKQSGSENWFGGAPFFLPLGYLLGRLPSEENRLKKDPNLAFHSFVEREGEVFP